jgi:hypothetical protein
MVALAVGGVGALLALVGWVLVIAEALRVNLGWGLGSLLIPAVAIVFAAMHWDRAKRGALLWLPGSLLASVAFGLLAFDHLETNRADMQSKAAAVQALAAAARQRALLEAELERSRAEADAKENGARPLGSSKQKPCGCNPGDPLCPCLRARLLLGRWPEPYRPDPKDLDVGAHAGIAMLGGLYVIVSPAVAIVLLGAAKLLGLSRRELLVAAVVYGVCYAAALATLRIDPGHFGEWLMD